MKISKIMKITIIIIINYILLISPSGVANATYININILTYKHINNLKMYIL